MRVGVVTFPGSLDDVDAQRAVRVGGNEAVALWHGDHDLRGVDAVVLPGGFSYGDYLRCGAISRFSPVMTEVVEAAGRGMPVLGALPRLGFSGVTDVRQGKRFELELTGEVTDDMLEQVRQMAETLLSNPVIENFEVRVEQGS